MKTQISLRISLIIVFVVCIKKLCILGCPDAPSEDSDQTANAQADLNLHWVHMFDVTFSDVATHLYKRII